MNVRSYMSYDMVSRCIPRPMHFIHSTIGNPIQATHLLIALAIHEWLDISIHIQALIYIWA